MATKTDPLESQHGEEEERPLFGDQSQLIDPEQADELQSHYDTPDAVPLDKGSGPGAEAPRELLDRENSGGVGSTGKASKKESSVADKLGKGFTPVDAALPPQAKIAKAVLGMFKSRKGQAGIATGGIVGGLIFMTSILQGPMQLVHLSQILQSNMQGGQNSSETRVRGIYMWARTGEVGYTRVGMAGEYIINKQKIKWEKMGISMDTGSNFGTPKSLTFDLSNEKSPFYRYNGLSKEAAIDGIARDLGVDPSKIGQISELDGKKISVSFANIGRKDVIGLMGNLRGYTDPESGRIANYINKRVNKKFYGTNLLHKLRKSSDDRASRKAKAAAEKERQKENRKSFREKVLGKKLEVSDKAKSRGIAAGAAALSGVQAVCIVDSLSGLVPEFNKAFRDDSVVAAYDLISIGAQVQAGEDIDMAQAGAVVDNFEDSGGENIWSSKALDATSGATDPEGSDIDPSMKQAYTGESSWDDINAFTGGIPGLDAACSPTGQIVIGLAGLGLVVAAGPGGGLIYQAAKIAGGAVAGAAVLNLATNLITPNVDPPEVISGAVGGNFVAYGAREAANVDSRSSGGVELSDSESAAIDKEIAEKNNGEFMQKSFFARMFDIYDYRSLASTGLVRLDFAPSTISSRLAESISLGGLASGIFSTFSPRVAAADNYDWGFNRYGIRQSVLNGSQYEDPVDNAEKAIDSIKSDSSLAERAKSCFGVELNAEANGFNVSESPDQYGESYLNSNCNDSSETWNRISVAIFDDRTATSLACYEAEAFGEGADFGAKACSDIESAEGTEVAGNSAGEGEDIGGGFTLQKYSPALDTPGGNIEPKGITLHWWAYDGNGDIESLANGLKGNKTCGPQGCSVQLGITKEGKIWQMTDSLTKLTYHAAGANATTFGIEIEGTPDQFGREGIEKYPEKFEAVVATVKWLMKEYDIKLDDDNKSKCDSAFGVQSHKYYSSCNPGKTDVDDYYLNEVRKRVKE